MSCPTLPTSKVVVVLISTRGQVHQSTSHIMMAWHHYNKTLFLCRAAHDTCNNPMKFNHKLYLGSTYSMDSEKGHTVQWGAYGVTPVVTMCMCLYSGLHQCVLVASESHLYRTTLWVVSGMHLDYVEI